mgnify:CR=1 FL=1
MVGLAAYGIYGGPAPYAATVDKYGDVTKAYRLERWPAILIIDRDRRVKYIGYERDINSQLATTGPEIDRILAGLLGPSE